MNKKHETPHQDLRDQAERRLAKTPADIAKMSMTEIQKLAYEFQVYQIELEMQNEELHTTQLQLRHAYERHQKLYDYAPIGFLSLNQQGYIKDANQASCELLRRSKTELQGTQLIRYIDIEDQDFFYLFFRNLLKTPDKQSIEFKITRYQDNITKTVACQGHYCSSDTSDNEFFVILQDITEQKRIEQAVYQLNEQLKQKVYAQSSELLSKNEKLQENINEIKNSKNKLIEREAKLNSIFNAAVEAILTIDQNGMIESANKAVSKIFGYQVDELIGQNICQLMPDPHKRNHDKYLKKYLCYHQPKIIGSIRQLEGLRKDGSLVPIDLSISTYEIDDKRYFTGMIRDASERKRKELLDKQHLDELAHVTRLGLMGEMASGIAHEVNQPLSAIATYCQVTSLLLKTDTPDLAKIREIVQKTEQQAQRAGQIISHMRQFISTNSVHRSTVDINQLVKNALGLAYDDCQQSSIECTLDLFDPLPGISADAIQIEQVLLNLIKNSADALSKLPKDKQRQLSIQTYLLDNKTIEVRVKDNALGINPADHAQIFTPFFTTKASGMGMGLSICHSLIASHGGELRFNSNSDKGTTFYFTLPIPEANNVH